MNTSTLISLRLACGLAVAGAALLSASSASAQTSPTSFYFQVVNSTFSGGDPVFSVTDDLTFTNLQVNETFANGFMQTILLPDLSTDPVNGGSVFTNTFRSSSPLTSAVLTGNIGSGPAQTVSTQTSIGGPITPQYVFSTFSADLFGPVQTGTALGTFSLDSGINGSNVVSSVNIVAPAAVPEASTTISLGLLLALGLGALAVSRRRAAAAN